MSLFAGAGLLVAAAAILQYQTSGTAIVLNPKTLGWMGDLRIDFARPVAPLTSEDTHIAAVTTQPAEFPDLSQIQIRTPLDRASTPSAHKTTITSGARTHRARRSVAKIQRLADELGTSLAAPLGTEQEVSANDQLASPEQLQKYQGISQLLRRQFLVASFHDFNDELTTQVSLELNDHSTTDYSPVVEVQHAKKRRNIRRHVSHDVLAQVPQVQVVPVKQIVVAAPQLVASIQLPLNRPGMAQTAYDMPIGPEPLSMVRPSISTTQTPEVIVNQDQLSHAQAASQSEHLEEAPGERTAQYPAVSSTESQDVPANTETTRAITTAAPTLISQLGYSSSVTTQSANKASTQVVDTQVLPQVAHQTVEFPDFQQPVNDGHRNAMTKDSLVESNPGRGWDLSRAAEHWPTLSIRSGAGSVPMVSNNSALMLAATLKTTLQPETGIVFGKIPAGWNIQFSGRAEHPLYISSAKQFVSAEAVDIDRYFIYLNAAPGTQTIQLIGKNVSSGGIATLPVLSGTATYMDFTGSTYRTVAGFVRDAATETGTALKAARVQIMGQPGSAVWTDAKGYFQIKQVLTLPGHSTQVDVQAAIQDVQTHVHRFSVYPEQQAAHDYYLFSEGDLKAWEDTLEGSTNAEAGMVIGAAPGLARSPNRYFASVTSTAGLRPEVYPLAPNGQMLAKAPLDSERPRFISLELGEGPTLVQLTDEANSTSLSHLVFASPRTVNILSFY